MTFRSNLREVQSCIYQLGSETFNMRRRRKVGSRSVGQELVKIIASLIRYRTVEQQLDENGQPLKPLKQRYLLWKLRRGYPSTISVMTGMMMRPDELEGEATITQQSVSLVYGKDEAARLEMEWFTEGHAGQNRPPRPVFDLGKDGEQAVMIYLDEVAAQHIRDLGG